MCISTLTSNTTGGDCPLQFPGDSSCLNDKFIFETSPTPVDTSSSVTDSDSCILWSKFTKWKRKWENGQKFHVQGPKISRKKIKYHNLLEHHFYIMKLTHTSGFRVSPYVLTTNTKNRGPAFTTVPHLNTTEFPIKCPP